MRAVGNGLIDELRPLLIKLRLVQSQPLLLIAQLRNELPVRLGLFLRVHRVDLAFSFGRSLLVIEGLFEIGDLLLQVVYLGELSLEVLLQIPDSGLVLLFLLPHYDELLGQLLYLHVVFLLNRRRSGSGCIPARSGPSLGATVPGGRFCL